MKKNKIKNKPSYIRAKKALQAIFPWLKPHWKLGILLIFFAMLFSAVSLASPLFMKYLIDEILLGQKLQLLWIFILLYALLILVLIAVRIVYSYLNRKLQLEVAFDVRNAFFENVEVLGIEFYKRYRVGDILSRIDIDVETYESVFNQLISLFLNIVGAFFILGIIFFLNWQIGLIIVAVLPAYIISQRYYVKKVRKLYAFIRRLSDGLYSFFEEKLAAISIVKIFGREDYELSREKQRSKQIMGMNLRTNLIGNFAASIVGIITSATLLGILGFGGYLVIINAMTVGALIAIYTYISGLFGPVEALANFWREIQPTLISIDRVDKVLKLHPLVQESPNAIPLKKVRGKITMKKAWFRYDKDLVLKDFTFEVKPGEHIGIVGPSGAGKTTLALLLLRFFDPQRGKVLVDDIDVRNLTIASLRKNIGYLPQEPTIFAASVMENIRYANPRAERNEVYAAARRAGADKFISRLPYGYKTRLGAKGSGLSGGERQRIALARLFLKNPAIVILDEPGAFLDVATEASIQEEFSGFFREKTFFIISHRLTTLKNVDRIFVLGDNRLSETGTLQELLQKKGKFYQFYETQHPPLPTVHEENKQ